MQQSLSQPSISTLGTGGTTHAERLSWRDISRRKHVTEKALNSVFWKGKMGTITHTVVSLPWNLWWQIFVLITIVYTYFALFKYYLDTVELWLQIINYLTELVFLFDVSIYLLHAFWDILKVHVRVYRRNMFLLFYDVVSLLPFRIVAQHVKGYPFDELGTFGRFLVMFRIYRLIAFIRNISETMHSSRKIIYILENATQICLVLHASTCMWYACHNSMTYEPEWHKMGYPTHIGAETLRFDTYLSCWYYCACRFYTVLFGDTFPGTTMETWVTSTLMLSGCLIFKYRFIGTLAWEYVKENSRRQTYIDQYRHMLKYLEFRGAPHWLIQQAEDYKVTLWKMKDGVLTSNHLQKLPLTLQMELIFDINVGYFHSSLLFRSTNEAFMRQMSLHMRHEIYLADQHIWSQDVVKGGMICIKHGVIEMLSDEDDESPMIAFTVGTVLGELSLFYSIPSKVTVKAATYVELQVLKRTDFMRAIAEQPHMLDPIRSQINTRIEDAFKRQMAINNYDNADSRLIRTRYRPMKVLKDNLAGIQNEDPTFVDDSHMYYRDDKNERQPKFTSEYLRLYTLSENVSNIDFPKISLRANFPWILEPNTTFTNMFEIIHFFMVLYLCMVVPYQVIIAEKVHEIHKILINTLVLVGLVLNIYMQLTTAIVNKNIRKVTVREIAAEKMSSLGFYLDIMSVFPMNIFANAFDHQGETAAGQIVNLVPLLQIWHLWDYFNKWQKNFKANIEFLNLTKYTIVITILCYWTGCFLYLFSCPRKLCRKNSWMNQLVYRETKIYLVTAAKHEKIAITSFFFGTAIVTLSGTAEVAPGPNDLLMVILLITFSSYLTCFYTAKICSLYNLSTKRKLKFKESMRELFYFLSVNHVSQRIKNRVKKFFCVQWYYNQAVTIDELFSDMSANIQQEVLSIEMVDTLVYCPLFQNCSRDFLQTVAANTRTIVLPDNEVVQRTADIGRDMYILQKGHCNVIDNYGTVIASIEHGNHFGVIEMFFSLPKVYTVVTTTNCVLLHVEYRALIQCLSTFPDISYPINAILEDKELIQLTTQFEVIKIMNNRIDTKKNRIAEELKESFVLLTRRKDYKHYVKAYEMLGILKYLRYIIFPLSITPHGMFLKCWCFLRLMLAVFYVITCPYNIATRNHHHGGEDYMVDVILYIDVIIMAYIAFYNKQRLLVTHPLHTISHYLRNGFFLDFITVFPFEILFKVINNQSNVDVCRINRLLQITRITSAFAYWEGDIMTVNHFVALLKFLPLAVVLTNIGTSFIFYNMCTTFVTNDSYFVMANCTRAAHTLHASDSNEQIVYAISEYINIFYWTFSVFIGCACRSEATINDSDTVLIMILQIIGLLYFAFMFGHVASSRSTLSDALLEHVEKIMDLSNFLFQQNVDPMLTFKTVKYFEHIWKRTNGSNPQQICRCLNSALMEDTLVFMYEKTLREVPLFGKVERSFIRVITQHLHEMYFLKGETVVQCRDVQSYIYIIYRGKVDVLSTYNEMVTCMGPGGMFGNFTGQSISCSEVTIYASRSLDLLVIPSQIFFNLVKYYPKIQEPLNKAFERSKDYILPITMDIEDSDNTDESDNEKMSKDSGADSRSGSSRLDYAGPISSRSSHSSVSRSETKFSISTSSSVNVYNMYKPGTRIYQIEIGVQSKAACRRLDRFNNYFKNSFWKYCLIFGYTSCVMATMSYVLVLYELTTLNDCLILFWIQTVIDLYFYLNVYFTQHRGYCNKYGDVIMDPAKCRRNYFKEKYRVWSDVIVNFPLEPIALILDNPMVILHHLRVFKLGRLKYLYQFYQETAAELTNNVITLQTMMTAFLIVILIHSFTCVWLVVALAVSPFKIIQSKKLYQIDDYNTPTNEEWDYVSAFYVVMGDLTTAGGDELVIKSHVLEGILCLSLICGKMLAAVVVATSMQIAYSTKHALNKYEKGIGELLDVLKNQGLSKYQLKKYWKYVTQLWISERGRQLPALLSETPYVRRCDLMSAMFGQYLRNSFIFCDAEEAFLRQLAAVMNYTIFFPGNYIVVAGDSEARMYWVMTGTVSVVSVHTDLTETTHELLTNGDVFGFMQGLNKGVCHCFSYRAETKVSIVTLSLDAWIDIVQFFPEAKNNIMKKADTIFNLV